MQLMNLTDPSVGGDSGSNLELKTVSSKPIRNIYFFGLDQKIREIISRPFVIKIIRYTFSAS